MSPENLRRLMLDLRRLDAAMGLPVARRAAEVLEEQHELLREALPHLPEDLKHRVRQLAPPS